MVDTLVGVYREYYYIFCIVEAKIELEVKIEVEMIIETRYKGSRHKHEARQGKI